MGNEVRQPTITLGTNVEIVRSDEQGKVIGRAEYLHGNEPQYFVEYVSNKGEATSGWFSEHELGLI